MFRFTKFIQVLTVILLTSVTAQSASIEPYIDLLIVEHYRNSAIRLLERAEKSGLRVLGHERKIPVRKLINEISKIRYQATSKFIKPEGAYRHSAFNSPASKTVFININSPVDTDFISVLGLHEALGALGFDDQNYNISFGLYLYANAVLEPQPLFDDFIVSPAEIQKAMDREPEIVPGPESVFTYGGVNFVGGAGDIRAVIYKHQLLELLSSVDLDSRTKLFYAKAIFNMDIEISADALELQYRTRNVPVRNLKDFMVVVPQDHIGDERQSREDLLSLASFIQLNWEALNDGH